MPLNLETLNKIGCSQVHIMSLEVLSTTTRESKVITLIMFCICCLCMSILWLARMFHRHWSHWKWHQCMHLDEASCAQVPCSPGMLCHLLLEWCVGTTFHRGPSELYICHWSESLHGLQLLEIQLAHKFHAVIWDGVAILLSFRDCTLSSGAPFGTAMYLFSGYPSCSNCQKSGLL